ncbi:thermonuclease family protein [Methylophaga sp. UBA2689]|uniref:thermonuclease family protein n=1 Tax=Methylophaga sp. UBA2689 TaxID=1946878 RepID=UPI0025F69CB2|nr:thermonuclease family protein [Methylophaga sp. UBA2689]|tara:strand:- start:558 stop:1391 length:834 start_codon:yes stop_codon:yes gene_type:complete
MTRYLFSVFLLFWLIGTVSATEIYQWTDDRGRQIFSDQPADPAAETIELTPSSNRYLFNVKRVYDGDTLILENNQRVRLLGINTPEISSHYREAEPGGIEARDWLKNQLSENQVYLQYDTEKRDRYDRLLAYAWTPDGDFINEKLLQKGLAALTLKPPNLQYADQLIAAQQQAINQKQGIWGNKHYQPRKITTITETAYRGWQRWLLTAESRAQTRDYWVLKVNDKASLRIAKEQQDLFPPLDSYLNKSLEVHGWMSKRGKQYSLFVQHPSAIKVLD